MESSLRGNLDSKDLYTIERITYAQQHKEPHGKTKTLGKSRNGKQVLKKANPRGCLVEKRKRQNKQRKELKHQNN